MGPIGFNRAKSADLSEPEVVEVRRRAIEAEARGAQVEPLPHLFRRLVEPFVQIAALLQRTRHVLPVHTRARTADV